MLNGCIADSQPRSAPHLKEGGAMGTEGEGGGHYPVGGLVISVPLGTYLKYLVGEDRGLGPCVAGIWGKCDGDGGGMGVLFLFHPRCVL